MQLRRASRHRTGFDGSSKARLIAERPTSSQSSTARRFAAPQTMNRTHRRCVSERRRAQRRRATAPRCRPAASTRSAVPRPWRAETRQEPRGNTRVPTSCELKPAKTADAERPSRTSHHNPRLRPAFAFAAPMDVPPDGALRSAVDEAGASGSAVSGGEDGRHAGRRSAAAEAAPTRETHPHRSPYNRRRRLQCRRGSHRAGADLCIPAPMRSSASWRRAPQLLSPRDSSHCAARASGRGNTRSPDKPKAGAHAGGPERRDIALYELHLDSGLPCPLARGAQTLGTISMPVT